MLEFIKMNASGNDFIIIDARKIDISIDSEQIAFFSKRQNIGCDQFIIIRSPDLALSKLAINEDALAKNNIIIFMEIYNADGSEARACGNATRAVAGLLFEETKKDAFSIATIAGIIKCNLRDNKKIAVELAIPTFTNADIPLVENFNNQIIDSQNINLFGHKFFALSVGNPHLVTFIDKSIEDEEFFRISPLIENHQYFPQKINVEFAKIIDDCNIDVRVWERGCGETLACGSGACAVAISAIKHNLVSSKKLLLHFKGGDIEVCWNNDIKDAPVVMVGDYYKIFYGKIII